MSNEIFWQNYPSKSAIEMLSLETTNVVRLKFKFDPHVHYEYNAKKIDEKVWLKILDLISKGSGLYRYLRVEKPPRTKVTPFHRIDEGQGVKRLTDNQKAWDLEQELNKIGF